MRPELLQVEGIAYYMHNNITASSRRSKKRRDGKKDGAPAKVSPENEKEIFIYLFFSLRRHFENYTWYYILITLEIGTIPARGFISQSPW